MTAALNSLFIEHGIARRGFSILPKSLFSRASLCGTCAYSKGGLFEMRASISYARFCSGDEVSELAGMRNAYAFCGVVLSIRTNYMRRQWRSL